MKNLALLLTLVAASAFAQAQPAGLTVTQGGALRARQYTTFAQINVYVDPTGSDTGSCMGTGTLACATIQGALNKIPRVLRNGATVTIAAGTYGCAIVSGFRADTSWQQTTGGLLINGTQIAATVATGTNTGTVTSVTTGTGSTFATVTDSGQSWTTNDLRGKYLFITAGTGVGTYALISSNTATAITLVGAANITAVAATYEIRTQGTFINTACSNAASAVAAAVANTSGMIITGNLLNYRASAITVRDIAFTNTSGTSVSISDISAVTLTRVSSVTGQNGTRFQLSGSSRIGHVLSQVYVVGPASSQSVFISRETATVSGSLIQGGLIGISASGGLVTITTSETLDVTQNPILVRDQSDVSIASSRIDGVAATGFTCVDVGNRNGSFNNSSPSYVVIASGTSTNVNFSDCGTTGSEIQASGNSQVSINSMSSSGSIAAVGFSLEYGAYLVFKGTDTALNATTAFSILGLTLPNYSDMVSNSSFRNLADGSTIYRR